MVVEKTDVITEDVTNEKRVKELLEEVSRRQPSNRSVSSTSLFQFKPDPEKAKIRKTDYAQTDELKELGSVTNLRVTLVGPNNEKGELTYTFNNSYYGIQYDVPATKNIQNELIEKMINQVEFQRLAGKISEQKNYIDFKNSRTMSHEKILSDKEETEHYNYIMTPILDKQKQDQGTIMFSDAPNSHPILFTEDKVERYLGGDIVSSSSDFCLVDWMNCVLNCVCGGTAGSCAIAISGCVGACCGCSTYATCIPCAGCAAGAMTCMYVTCADTGGGGKSVIYATDTEYIE
jgi:hypothetical protein